MLFAILVSGCSDDIIPELNFNENFDEINKLKKDTCDYNCRLPKFILILKVENEKMEIIDGIKTNFDFECFDNDFNITENNIFYDSYKNKEYNYAYNNKFYISKYRHNETQQSKETIDVVGRCGEIYKNVLKCCDINNYTIATLDNIKRNKGYSIFIIDNERDIILGAFDFEFSEYYINDFYFHNNKLFFVSCIDTKYCAHIIVTIILDIHGNFSIRHKHLYKCVEVSEFCEHACIYEKYILINENGESCIYDFVQDEIIAMNDFGSICYLDGFVRLNDVEKNNNKNNIGDTLFDNEIMDNKLNYESARSYENDNELIKIKTIDKCVLYDKQKLIYISEYFKNIFSGNFSEVCEIEFDIESNILEYVLYYVSDEKIKFRSINDLINIYEFCDKILFTELQNEIADLLYNEYYMDAEKTQVKIYKKKFLKELPKTIKTIIFDKNFNENVDGLIMDGVETLIFGKYFTKDINDLPSSVKNIYVGNDWNSKSKYNIKTNRYKNLIDYRTSVCEKLTNDSHCDNNICDNKEIFIFAILADCSYESRDHFDLYQSEGNMILIFETDCNIVNLVDYVGFIDDIKEIIYFAIDNINMFYDKLDDFNSDEMLDNLFYMYNERFSVCWFCIDEEENIIDTNIKLDDEIIYKKSIGDYSVLLIGSYQDGRYSILFNDNKKNEVILITETIKSSNGPCEIYCLDGKLYATVNFFADNINKNIQDTIKLKKDNPFIKIYELNKDGCISKYNIYFDELCEYFSLSKNVSVKIHNNYILHYNYDNMELCIYDYIHKKCVMKSDQYSFDFISGFVEIKKRGNLKIYE